MNRFVWGGLLLGAILGFGAVVPRSRGPRERATARTRVDGHPTARDALRRSANVVLAVAQQLTPLLATVTGLGVDISTRAARGEPTAIEPAGYAFIVWAYIYPACIAYAVYQALPSRRESPMLRRVGALTVWAFFANALWAVAAQLAPDAWLWLTVPIIVGILAPLLAALPRFRDLGGRESAADRALVVVPLSVFAGWITVATFANTSVFAAAGFDNFGLSDTSWTTIRLLSATALAAWATRLSGGNVAYAAAVVWALAGIVVTNVAVRPDAVVAGTAGAAIALEIAVLARSRRAPRTEA